MKPVILITRLISEKVIAELQTDFTLLGPIETLDGKGLPVGAEQAEVLLTMSSLPTRRELIEALPSVKLVCCYGSGTEFVDYDCLREKGIQLTNAAGANAASVAEFTLGMILSCQRQIVESQLFLRSGKWLGNVVERYPLVRGVQGKRLGIYGFGEIGKEVASRAVAFDMEIGYCTRSQKETPFRCFDSIEALAEWADILVLAARGSANNYHIVGEKVLNLLGSAGCLINVARGILVDEAALISALQQHRLGCAALDVFEGEPHLSQPLADAPRLLLTPHVAANTLSAQQAQQQRMVQNARRYFDGQPLTGRVL